VIANALRGLTLGDGRRASWQCSRRSPSASIVVAPVEPEHRASQDGTVTDPDSTAADLRWLAATWPFVRQYLPPPPCRVVDLGCGPLGGFVPALRAEGFDAEGVDPEAPAGPHYHQVRFEE